MWPFSKGTAAKGLQLPTKDEMEVILMSLKGYGAHFAVYYANLSGFQHEAIKPEWFSEFMTYIQSEPNFTDRGIEYAANLLTKNINFICGSEYFDKFVFGSTENRNFDDKDCIYKFKNAVVKFGFRNVCKQIEFDPDTFLQGIAKERRKNDIDKIVEKFEERKSYLKPLLLQAKVRGRNKYGEIEYGEYIKEIGDFLDYYFKEGSLRFFYTYYPLAYCVMYLERWFLDDGAAQSLPPDGVAFEYWCAAQLEKQGWAARVTKASGDQGIDIVATKGEIVVAIQCKRYGQPVSNKAVQEACAGKIHYQANIACVIGTGGFTASAQELAKSTAVVLLDAESVASFTDAIGRGKGDGGN